MAKRKNRANRGSPLEFINISTDLSQDGDSVSYTGMAAESGQGFAALGVLLDNLAKHTYNIDYLFQNRILGILKKMTARRFETGKTEFGSWPELSDMRIKQRLEKTLHRRVTKDEIESMAGINNPEQPILRDTLMLEKSFRGTVTKTQGGAELVWGSDELFAPLLELGGTNEAGFEVPPRPMATPGNAELQMIYDRLLNYYTKFLRQPFDPQLASSKTVPF